MSDLIIYEQDLADNPTARIPVCLVLDTSGSMEGDPINELNKGVTMFMNEILKDEITRYSTEISVVTFGGTVNKVLDFGNIDNQQIPIFSASGGTPTGEAVETSIEMLNDRKNEYQKAGVDYYQPWMVLMTDAQPTDNIENAVVQVCNLIENRKLTIFPIGIGEAADMDVLARFSPKRSPMKLQGLKFKEFFEWLSQSVSIVSQSIPGEKIELDTEGLKGWADLEI
jgi:uncharacterized protein YegL|tara:strand:+ start:1734 stop:2411 length:678 start_codon:yes stop_codon:yes gene_type:complete